MKISQYISQSQKAGQPFFSYPAVLHKLDILLSLIPWIFWRYWQGLVAFLSLFCCKVSIDAFFVITSKVMVKNFSFGRAVPLLSSSCWVAVLMSQIGNEELAGLTCQAFLECLPTSCTQCREAGGNVAMCYCRPEWHWCKKWIDATWNNDWQRREVFIDLGFPISNALWTLK